MKHMNVALFVPHLGCPHTCIFCDQRVISGKTAPITADAINEACRTAAACPHEKENSEIAFFGGSFTAVPRETMRLCLDAAAPFLRSDFGGIRVSTRPDAVDAEGLAFLKAKGVRAVELGAQSMDDGVLEKNERGHTAADTVRAARQIKEAGLSLGLQMMTGMYGSTPALDRETAAAFLRLRPDTVRIYPTVVLENTVLATLYRKGLYQPPDLQESVGLCADLLRMFTAAGIHVIRLGLHSGGNVEEHRIAGVYHPAFRELCESRIYRQALEAALRGLPKGQVLVTVRRGDESKATGHKGENRRYFAAEGYRMKIIGTDGRPAYAPLVTACTEEKRTESETKRISRCI